MAEQVRAPTLNPTPLASRDVARPANDGARKSKKVNDAGMGLKFMNYRAHMIGAFLNADYIKNGFRVEVRMELH